MKKTQLEKDIEATIRLLRFMTWGEGTVYLGVFDSGSFEHGSITAYLERSGLTIQNKQFYSPKEFKTFLMSAANPFHFTDDEINDRYSKNKWDRE